MVFLQQSLLGKVYTARAKHNLVVLKEYGSAEVCTSQARPQLLKGGPWIKYGFTQSHKPPLYPKRPKEI